MYKTKECAVLLRKLREKHHLSQAKAAELIGVSQNAYNQWESGKCKPNAINTINIAKLFGIGVEELFFEEDSKRKP
jgi:DNA-binding XRE family transcriptional regulator